MDDLLITDLFFEAAKSYEAEGESNTSFALMFIVACAVGIVVGAADLVVFYLNNIYGGM